jgi:hypothetical protein
MAAENPTWGAPRIHGEFRMLGIEVSERTVSRYLPRHRPPPGALERWIQFLRNHSDTIAGMDFFTVPTVTFRVLYVWFAIDHASRRILHFDVTDHPAAVWVASSCARRFLTTPARATSSSIVMRSSVTTSYRWRARSALCTTGTTGRRKETPDGFWRATPASSGN